MWEPRDDFGLGLVEKLMVVQIIRVLAKVNANQLIQVVHQIGGKEILNHNITVALKTSGNTIQFHGFTFWQLCSGIVHVCSDVAKKTQQVDAHVFRPDNQAMRIIALLVLLTITLCVRAAETMAVDTQPYPSIFGANVMLFDPDMDMNTVQRSLDALHNQQANDEFSERRYALLFKPGEYDLDVTVDYYVQAAGLGQVPGDVRIKGAVQSISSTTENRVTIMFWRSAENFYVSPRDSNEPIYWAVSQAAPYRRMHIKGNLRFDLGGWASGGFLANSIVEGTAGLTSGQQWFTRNSELREWVGGNWNRTFVGSSGTPVTTWPNTPTTIVDYTPVIREKPFVVIDDADEFSVFVPSLAKSTRGVSWRGGAEIGKHIPISDFYIAFPEKDSATSINSALSAGKHLLFTPGIYSLDQAIRIRRPGTVVMGMGLATLLPETGKAAIVTDDVPGITISSLMVDAGPQHSPVLIQIGDIDARKDHSENPTTLHDVFCRVGGAVAGSADACLIVNSNDVIIDHTWLWRADHGAGAEWAVNRSKNGLLVNGDDVTIFGLFNEHFQEYQTVWSGERGRVYFYQSEIPYDPPSHEAWRSGSEEGYASYKVAEHVQVHEAHGLGIYSFFRAQQEQDTDVRLKSAIEVPETKDVRINHVSIFSGRSGGIDHAINGQGEATNVGELTHFDGINSEHAK